MTEARPLLDKSVLVELRELGEEELVREMIELFLEDTPDRLAEIHKAGQARDLGGLQQAAHSLKSSSANLGAVRLSAMCGELERLSREACLEAALVLVASFEAAFQQVETALTDYGKAHGHDQL